MTDILAGSYMRVYGKSWLCSFSRESGDMLTSSLCGTMGVGFIGSFTAVFLRCKINVHMLVTRFAL